MSISSALSNALTGLTASSRAAGVVSTNLANVLTEGYAVRNIELTTQGDGRGGGVSVVGVTRDVDLGLLSERRAADSDLAYNDALFQFSARLETEIGTPDDQSSLSARIAAFEASLASASTKPEEEARLNEVLLRGAELSLKLNRISDRIQTERTSVEGQIEQAVTTVNTLLDQVQSLNAQISNARNTGHPTASFEDQRQTVVDNLAEFVPLRTAERGNGTLALYTPGGAILIDGSAAELSFSASNLVAPHMTLDNGLLSGLEINGVAIAPSGDRSPIAGGRLAALFEIRDGFAVDAQAQVDATARNLIERFQQAGLDTTRAVGDPGLFTDDGAAFDPVNEIGIAGRIDLNALVDPAQGGAAWRLRDGLGATAPGPVGNASLILQYSDVMSAAGALASGNLGATERSFSGHASSFVSRIGQQKITVDQNLSFAASRQSGLKDIELRQGVDSDEQLQRLLLVEQAYSANARMIQTVDDLIQTLLRI
ncbi:MAG: flagellar hook-associated protein FlgK [Pseudomonadota bacterium]